MSKFIALPALALVFVVSACATAKEASAPSKPADATPPYAGQSTPGEPALITAPRKKEQGS